MAWWVPVAMAAAGAMKSKMDSDRAQQIEEQDTQLAAETAKWSPWTGMRPNQIRRAGSGTSAVMGGAMQGFTSGMMMGQGGGFRLDKPNAKQAAGDNWWSQPQKSDQYDEWTRNRRTT